MDSVVSSLEENNGVNEVISKIFVVAEKNGLKLPREFGLLLKQVSLFVRVAFIIYDSNLFIVSGIIF
jgi:hypothetical protein